MARFVTERKFEVAGNLTREELKAIARMFTRASGETGNGFRWLRAYVTEGGVLYDCIAEESDQVREHAERVGFGELGSIVEVVAVIGPDTAEDSVREDQ
ncbi:MAG: nickel-binding protein [Actinomycetota bacterium]